MENYNEGHPLHLRSSTLNSFLYNLDDKLDMMEHTIREQKAKIKQLEDEKWKLQHEQVKAGHAMIGHTLSAILGTPPKEAMSPVMATMLVKIGNMQSIEQVHAYINSIKKDWADDEESV